jgi:hypothetical protein
VLFMYTASEGTDDGIEAPDEMPVGKAKEVLEAKGGKDEVAFTKELFARAVGAAVADI